MWRRTLEITVQRFYAILKGQCRISAFQPITRNFELLQQNRQFVSANQLYRFNIALEDQDETITLCYNLRHGVVSLISAMRRRHGSEYRRAVKEVDVRISRIDTVLQRPKLLTPASFKLDVEGAGGLVLRGAAELFATAQPTY